MTKEITKAYILQQMQDKFGLRELIPEVFSFHETVIPTYNVEQHLLTHISKYAEAQVTATGALPFFQVPENERWHFDRYDVIFMAAGAYTVAGVFVKRKAFVDTVYLDLTAAQTVSYHINLPVAQVMDPGDRLKINIDGYTSLANLRLYLDYTKEEIR